jgi:hypothetical protein
VVGGGQEGALQGAFTPVLDGADRFGEKAEHVAGFAAVLKKAALLCFP